MRPDPMRLAILGSTGSIGQSALAVVDAHPSRLQVVGLAAGTSADALAQQVERYRPRAVVLAADAARDALRAGLTPAAGAGLDLCGAGPNALVELVTREDVDTVLCASSGTAALEAVVAAIKAGKRIALANKEVLVMAGRLVMDLARTHGVDVLPVDSEHNAIHQCLHRREASEVRRLILTASGGPFRHLGAEALASVTVAAALSHPTWRMGRKITIDSATLMNKGLEVIEAHWLFGTPASAIDVVVHPQSVVHSLVELTDGSIIAQLGVTDMRLPIQYAFSWPERWDGALPTLSLLDCRRLEFEPPDHDRFPCLRLAYQALKAGDAYPVVLNAANEVAVASFLEGAVPFPAIAEVIDAALAAAARQGVQAPDSLAAIRELDAWSRTYTGSRLQAASAR